MKFVCTLLAAAALGVVGCSDKKNVVDVKTPIGDVQVNKDSSSGDVEVKVEAGKAETTVE